MNYTLLVYNNQNRLLDSLIIENPEVEGRNVRFKDGYLENISANFIILEGNLLLENGFDVTELINDDIKTSLKPYKEKTAQQLQSMQLMINTVMMDPNKAKQTKQIADMQKMINNLMFQNMPKL